MSRQPRLAAAWRFRTWPVWPALAFALLYYAACALSVLLAHDPVTAAALFWLAAGVGLAGIVRLGLRGAWFVPLALIACHATLAPMPPVYVAWSVLGQTAATIAGGWFATRETPPRFTLAQTLAFLCGGIALAAISTLAGLAGLHALGLLPPGSGLAMALRWFLLQLLGVIVVAPALMLQRPRADDSASERYREYGSEPERLGWLVLLVTSFLLMAWSTSVGGHYPLGVIALPLALLTWCAMRFPPWWTPRAVLLTSVMIAGLAGVGQAGLVLPGDALGTVRLLGFVCVITALPLVLAVVNHERRVAAHRQLRSATTEALTGLPNRVAFERQVRQMLAMPGAPPRALVYLDLDHLKLVNDTASHAAGDALIRRIASVLQANARTGDAVGHLGGDEFGLLLHNCLPAAAEERARQLLREVECYRCGWQERTLGVTASIGLVPFQGEQDFARLLSQADAACFTAKELGGNQVVRAALDGGERFDHTQAMRSAMRVREAVEKHDITLYSQEIVPLHGGAGGRHFELLLRLKDPASGELLMPGQFLAAAERYRLSLRIDREVVACALDWLERHADAREIDLCCINLSAEAIVDEGFIGFLRERLRQSAFPPSKLCLEITETTALRDVARAQRFIAQMRALGCRFALDDFGTGFCSFGYLRSLDVDYFKIDGSFVREMHSSPLALQIVRSITDIAHVLDKRSIAEHAEAPEHVATLRELGVDFAQGYALHVPEPIETYFARPVTAH